jgi:uncharacterized lipoprotein YmbA
MKRGDIFFKGLMCVCFSLVLHGCVSVADSPTPRFYTFQAIDAAQVNTAFTITPEVIIGVGLVKIPDYLDRPQIVTVGKDNLLTFAQFDRWGESLGAALTRLLREDLTVMLPAAKFTAYPWDWAFPVKYQVVVEVIQLDSQLDKDLFFAAQWSIIDAQSAKMLLMKRSEFRKPISPQDYSGLAKTLSMACASLSSEIAEALAALESQTVTKESVPELK